LREQNIEDTWTRNEEPVTDDRIPYSELATPEAVRNARESDDALDAFLDYVKHDSPADVAAVREAYEEILIGPWLDRLLVEFPVTTETVTLGGVAVDVVVPSGGVRPRNEGRVLINLHGGGYGLGGRKTRLQESVSIAGHGGFKVVSVDYRMAPEHLFPAASDDVAAVYRALLEDYRPGDIGIYGCSAGGVLTHQAVAWFGAHDIPRPAAIASVNAGGLPWLWGDSRRTAAYLAGREFVDGGGIPYLAESDLRGPLVSPAFHPDVLRDFPPTLIISGTRDNLLSTAVYSHAQLVKAGVVADLHVWETAVHCSISHGVVDPTVPETREAWDVMVRFFDRHLA
jgi:acetyl esterase/lipase